MQVSHYHALLTLSFLIYFPAQSGPSDDRGNTPLLPCADGVIRPRASGDPFLEGEVLFVAMGNVPQPI